MAAENVSFGVEPKGRLKWHIRAPKGHSALWKGLAKTKCCVAELPLMVRYSCIYNEHMWLSQYTAITYHSKYLPCGSGDVIRNFWNLRMLAGVARERLVA